MRTLSIFNSLTRTVEKFEPLNPPLVTYYSCGPTVYSRQHLGNMRSYLFADTLKRALEFDGFTVRHVMNITDVGHMTSDADAGEDKVEMAAHAEGRSPQELAARYTQAFLGDLEQLNVEPAEVYCRATDHITDMIGLIGRIIERGYAYVAPSGVYFDVVRYRACGRSVAEAKGSGRPGRLSRQRLEEQHSAQRLEHAPDKRSPHDFALWVLNQPRHLMQWDRPWGRGYPGWHVECSAMAMKYLGETIDLHSGGIDHIPIHHENEIAQSESATGKPFARYFVHNAFLVGSEGAKISKSAGRFPVLDDLVAAGINPLAFRLFCFAAKYRSELGFSLDALKAAERNLYYLWGFTKVARPEQPDAPFARDYYERFAEALNDDLNTPRALAAALELVAEAYRRSDLRVWQTLTALDRVMGLRLEAQLNYVRASRLPDDIQALVDRRTRARAERNFELADQLRQELVARGYEVRDRRDGSSSYAPRWS